MCINRLPFNNVQVDLQLLTEVNDVYINDKRSKYFIHAIKQYQFYIQNIIPYQLRKASISDLNRCTYQLYIFISVLELQVVKFFVGK